MKKNPVYLLLTVTAALTLTFAACKKSNTTDPNADFTMQSDDQSQFTAETDAIADEAYTLIESNTTFSGRNMTSSICDATVEAVADPNADLKKITITYNGANCSDASRSRTGSVVISMPTAVKWTDAGATITVTYNEVKIVRKRDKKSLTLNGVVMVTNERGSKIENLLAKQVDTLSHSISSEGLSVKFNDGTQHNWQVAKRRTFYTDVENKIVISTTGTHNEGISEWGVNRLGNDFSTKIAEPLIVRQGCSFRLTSGKVEYNSNLKLAITFGLDAFGQPVSACPTGSYYFKVEWADVRTTNTYSIIWPY